MKYVTIQELSNIIRHNLWKIPHDIDLVVGVPRSGMLPASMIALYLNTNLGDIDSLLEGRHFALGRTRQHMMKRQDIKKVLVVDDSVNTGKSIIGAKDALNPIASKYEFVYLTPITTSRSKELVDIYLEIIDDARIFEWNLFHHDSLNHACFDLDGVFCCDPKIDDDGEQYIHFLKTAEPLFIPTAPINTIITCRLEKYRKQTEAWLSKYDINYQRLIMLNMPTKAERIKWGRHGEYKAEYYKKSECTLFVESSYQQALTIAQISHKDVFCIETNSIINIPSVPQKTKEKLKIITPNFVLKIYRKFIKL